MDICKQNLRSDFNIIKEVEKLCRISGTENPDDKEKRLDDENDKMKKPFGKTIFLVIIKITVVPFFSDSNARR